VDRRAFIGTVAGGLLAAPLAAEAQRPDRIRRIGILLFSQQDLAVITPCLQELKVLGYVGTARPSPWNIGTRKDSMSDFQDWRRS
jgi:hypothetical protein